MNDENISILGLNNIGNTKYENNIQNLIKTLTKNGFNVHLDIKIEHDKCNFELLKNILNNYLTNNNNFDNKEVDKEDIKESKQSECFNKSLNSYCSNKKLVVHKYNEIDKEGKKEIKNLFDKYLINDKIKIEKN